MWLPRSVASLSLLLLVVVTALRVPYPFELEWMEGGMLEHLTRVLHGQPLYVEPNLTFGAYPYTPLFMWISAAASSVLGEGFLAPRLVSVASTLAILVGLYLFNRRADSGTDAGQRSSTSRTGGLVASGFFAAGAIWLGCWTDLARVDALATAFMLGSVLAIKGSRDARAPLGRVALAGALSVAACMTKQSSLLLAVALVPACAWEHGPSLRRPNLRTATLFAAIALGGTALCVGVVNSHSDDWLKFATYDILMGAPSMDGAVMSYVREIGLALGAVFALWLLAARAERDQPLDTLLLLVVPALLITGLAGRSHQGGFENTLLPSLLAAALVIGPAATRLFEARRRTLACIAVATAFLPLVRDPRPLLPSQEDELAGAALVERVRGLDAPVWIPDHGYLARLASGADEQGTIHGIVINDILKSGIDAVAARFVGELEAALRERRFGAILLDDRWSDLPALSQNYLPPTPLWSADDNAFLPVTGSAKRPEWLYLRR